MHEDNLKLLQSCSAIMAATFSVENGHGRTFMGICKSLCVGLIVVVGGDLMTKREDCGNLYFFLLDQ